MKFNRLFNEKGLSLERLAALVEVDDAGGIANAAPDDDNRQSLICRQLAELERFFQVELKGKFGKTIRLTPAGKLLAEYARDHLQSLEEFHRTCRQQPTEIVLGAGDSLLQWLVLPRVRQLRETLKGTIVELQDLQNVQIHHQLLDQSIDFGLLRSDLLGSKKLKRKKPDSELKRKTKDPLPLAGVPLGKFGYSLFISDKLWPRNRKATEAELLQKLPLATQGGNTRFQRDLEEVAASQNWTLNAQLYCESFPQAAQALASGQLAVILPDLARLNISFDTVWVQPLKSLDGLRREVCLTWHKHRIETRPYLDSVKHKLAEVLKFTY
jgi:DNA-binding transcriptional LysR family regulator